MRKKDAALTIIRFTKTISDHANISDSYGSLQNGDTMDEQGRDVGQARRETEKLQENTRDNSGV